VCLLFATDAKGRLWRRTWGPRKGESCRIPFEIVPPPSSGACPDRAAPRAAGLQAAPAGGGGARGGPPAPGGRRGRRRGMLGRAGRGRRGGAKSALNFLSAAHRTYRGQSRESCAFVRRQESHPTRFDFINRADDLHASFRHTRLSFRRIQDLANRPPHVAFDGTR
jgi:hypothetical protein